MNNKKALKSGIAYTISSFFVSGITFITVPLFTRLMSKAEFGIYNSFTSWQSIIMIIATLSLSASFISARYDYKDEFDSYILSMIGLMGCVVLSITSFIVLLPDIAESVIGVRSEYILLMLGYIFFSQIISMFQVRAQYKYEYIKSVIISISVSISTVFVSLLLVYCFDDKLYGRIIGSTLPTIIIGVFLFLYFIREGRKVDISFWKYAIPICVPYIPHLLSLTVLNASDKIMITRICGDEQTALYSLAYSCSYIVTILVSSMNSAFAPWLTEQIHEQNDENVRGISRKYIVFFITLLFGFLLIAPEVLWILGGDDYMESLNVMPPVMIGCAFQLMYTMYVNVEQYYKKTKGMAIASVLAALFNVGLNYILIPKYGYLAAAYTTLICYLFLLLMHMWLSNRIKVIYDNKFVVGMTLLLGGIMALTLGIYKLQVIRYVFMLVYTLCLLIVVIRHKSTIISVIKRRKNNV